MSTEKIDEMIRQALEELEAAPDPSGARAGRGNAHARYVLDQYAALVREDSTADPDATPDVALPIALTRESRPADTKPIETIARRVLARVKRR